MSVKKMFGLKGSKDGTNVVQYPSRQYKVRVLITIDRERDLNEGFLP